MTTATSSRPAIFLAGQTSPMLDGPLAERYRVFTRSDLATPGVAESIAAAVTNAPTGIATEILKELPNLKLVALHGIGTDKIDLAYLAARNIPVTRTDIPEITSDVADLALALWLAASRSIASDDAYMRRGDWAAKKPRPLARAATGQRIGLIGVGRIGLAIGKRLEPFTKDIAYWARGKRDVAYTYMDDLKALAAWADALFVNVAGGPETQHLVSRAVLEALGPEGMLINIARGSVVDEDAMIDLLANGKLGMAGLDVYTREPDAPTALFALDNVVLLPHRGSATRETRQAMADEVLKSLAAHIG